MVAMASKAKADEKKSLTLKIIMVGVGWYEGVGERTGVVRLLLQRKWRDLYSPALRWLCSAIMVTCDRSGSKGRQLFSFGSTPLHRLGVPAQQLFIDVFKQPIQQCKQEMLQDARRQVSS